MQEEILQKLYKILEEDIVNEYQVVYILSRIRKYLEIKNKQSRYKILNFYCNWALHARIERTEPIGDELRKFINGTDDEDFLKFEYLRKDLQKFLQENELPVHIVGAEAYMRFVNILIDIYQDTPLEVYAEQKRVITISRSTLSYKYPFSISYSIK